MPQYYNVTWIKHGWRTAHLLDDLFSYCFYEVFISGIHGTGKHEVLPNLKTHRRKPKLQPSETFRNWTNINNQQAIKSNNKFQYELNWTKLRHDWMMRYCMSDTNVMHRDRTYSTFSDSTLITSNLKEYEQLKLTTFEYTERSTMDTEHWPQTFSPTFTISAKTIVLINSTMVLNQKASYPLSTSTVVASHINFNRIRDYVHSFFTAVQHHCHLWNLD